MIEHEEFKSGNDDQQSEHPEHPEHVEIDWWLVLIVVVTILALVGRFAKWW